MSNNLDNLLTDIYSSESQSQGVKELANLINNLSNLLLKAISQLEGRVSKLEQQVSRGGPAPSSPLAPATTPAPMPKTASPFSPAAPVRSAPPPPPPQQRATPSPAAAATGAPSAAQAASMLGATLKPAPKKTATPATSPTAAAPAASGSGPSFLTGVVNPNAKTTTPSTVSTAGGPSAAAPDAMAPASGGIAGPAGGFKGELAEKLARRRQKVQQQLEDDFEAPDLAVTPEEELVEEDASASSELKLDLEDELRNAFSKLKG